MKMLAEYLEHAIKFEQMAAQECDAQLRAALEKQAVAYRALAEKRAKEFASIRREVEMPRALVFPLTGFK